MEHFFIPKGDTKKLINREHDGDCAMAGKGTFCCDACLKASAEILSDPLLAGVAAVKWAVNVDLMENGKTSEFYQEPTKIPDNRMACGYRIDRRPPYMREELDPARADEWQERVKEQIAKAEAAPKEPRKAKKAAEKPKGA